MSFTRTTLFTIILVIFCFSVVRTFDCGLVYNPNTESYSLFSKKYLVPYCLPTTESDTSTSEESAHYLCNWKFDFVELSRETFESFAYPSKDKSYQDYLADTFYSLPEYTISPIEDVVKNGLSNSELYLVERACASVGGYDIFSSEYFPNDLEIDSLIIREFITIHSTLDKKIHNCSFKQMWGFLGLRDPLSSNCEDETGTTNHVLPIIADPETLDFILSSYSFQMIDFNFYHCPFKCIPLVKQSTEQDPENIIILDSILYSISERVSLQKHE